MRKALGWVAAWGAGAARGGRAAAGAQRATHHVWRAAAAGLQVQQPGAARPRAPGLGRSPVAAAWGGAARALSGPAGGEATGASPAGPGAVAKAEPEFDPELLRALEIDHIPPARIAEALRSENITIEQLKMLVDEGFHQSPEGGNMAMGAAEQAAMSRNADAWSMDLVHQLNPRRRFFPGQTYLPEELSPNYQVDYTKLREEQRKQGCPLGGKKGPKIDFTNVGTLSRFLTEGGQIMPRRKTMVCAKKQRELKTAVKRARTMNLIPYKSKLPQFQKSENPFLDS